MNSLNNARNGNVRRVVAKVPVGNSWDAGKSKCKPAGALSHEQHAKIAAGRPLPKPDTQEDRDAIAAYLARVN